MKKTVIVVFTLALFGCATVSDNTMESYTSTVADFVGGWDVTILTENGSFPSWFEITNDNNSLAGRFVGRVGSVRPMHEISITGDSIYFSLPVQFESHSSDMEFKGNLEANTFSGTTNAEDGSGLTWTAVRAPELTRQAEWGEPIELIKGNDLTGWHLRNENAENNWDVESGILANKSKGTDLITDEIFEDFKLHLEFMYPEKSNSGVYLRGRYEVQIQDDFGKEAHSLFIGGVYGFLTPSKNAGKSVNEWQSYDITLVGRTVIIELNGEKIIDKQIIPGITGGALDSNEGAPGPIMLQGDHGQISFRNIVLTPAIR